MVIYAFDGKLAVKWRLAGTCSKSVEGGLIYVITYVTSLHHSQRSRHVRVWSQRIFSVGSWQPVTSSSCVFSTELISSGFCYSQIQLHRVLQAPHKMMSRSDIMADTILYKNNNMPFIPSSKYWYLPWLVARQAQQKFDDTIIQSSADYHHVRLLTYSNSSNSIQSNSWPFPREINWGWALSSAISLLSHLAYFYWRHISVSYHQIHQTHCGVANSPDFNLSVLNKAATYNQNFDFDRRHAQ